MDNQSRNETEQELNRSQHGQQMQQNQPQSQQNQEGQHERREGHEEQQQLGTLRFPEGPWPQPTQQSQQNQEGQQERREGHEEQQQLGTLRFPEGPWPQPYALGSQQDGMRQDFLIRPLENQNGPPLAQEPPASVTINVGMAPQYPTSNSHALFTAGAYMNDPSLSLPFQRNLEVKSEGGAQSALQYQQPQQPVLYAYTPNLPDNNINRFGHPAIQEVLHGKPQDFSNGYVPQSFLAQNVVHYPFPGLGQCQQGQLYQQHAAQEIPAPADQHRMLLQQQHLFQVAQHNQYVNQQFSHAPLMLVLPPQAPLLENGARSAQEMGNEAQASFQTAFLPNLNYPGSDIASTPPTDEKPPLGEGRGTRNAMKSKYRGVSWHKRGKKWISRIWLSGRSVHVGVFDTEKVAAAFVDQRLLSAGDKGTLNFPDAKERNAILASYEQTKTTKGSAKKKNAVALVGGEKSAKKRSSLSCTEILNPKPKKLQAKKL